MARIKAKSVLAYMILPRIIPRAKDLFASGFGYIAFLMANIYNTVRLLPNNHPYLQPDNIGAFGIRHVIAAAANNLVLTRQNIDQVIVFFAMLAAVVVLLSQIIVLAYVYVVTPALAQGITVSLFDTPNPVTPGVNTLQDIAFILLDEVFGVPGIFCNSANTCTEIQPDLPQPFHIALHDLFRFYSTALLIIGAVIFLYFVVVIILETASTGSPFGQRFQNGWVPIRLVVALGLLVPINYGLNSGQLITLYVAKFGSGFATNAWLVYNRALAGTDAFGNTAASPNRQTAQNPTGENGSLLALPTAPDFTPLVQAMGLVHACAYAEWHMDLSSPDDHMPPGANAKIQPYFVKKASPRFPNQQEFMPVLAGTTYEEALDFYNNANILIVFGERDTAKYPDYPGSVFPTCGDMRVTIADLAHIGEGDTVGGADMIQEYYFNMVRDMWHDPSGGFGGPDYELITLSQRYMSVALYERWLGNFIGSMQRVQCTIGCSNMRLPSCTTSYADPCQNAGGPGITGIGADCERTTPCVIAKQFFLNYYNADVADKVLEAWDKFNDVANDFDMTSDIMDLGWGGAGLWFNKINQINGGFITAVVNVPAPVRLPYIMEKVQELKMAEGQDVDPNEAYSPHMSDGSKIPGLTPKEFSIAEGMNGYFQWWNKDNANQANTSKVVTGSVFRDVMNMMFGTDGLFAMRGRNSHIHPLAQMAALGKSLVDAAVRNVGMSIFAAAIGGPVNAIAGSIAGGALSAISGFLTSTAFVGLTAGLLLFYIVPFMPFLYFFFAVGEWVKAIFEAMVGVPLWALAHLRLDGEGLPGDSASNGYFLLFEIFIRPILCLFGLVAAISIFTAQVRILNIIWLLVIDNLTGFSTAADTTISVLYEFEMQRDVVDQFFFTVVYAVIIHMLSTAVFKMVDNVPKSILRWAGSGVSSFGDTNSNRPLEGLQQYAVMGGLTVGKDTTRALTTAARGGGDILGTMLSSKKP